jgi:hypothetical protein
MRPRHWLYTIPLRLRSIFLRHRVEQELQEELQFHLEQRIAQEIGAGKTREEARRAALRAMEVVCVKFCKKGRDLDASSV